MDSRSGEERNEGCSGHHFRHTSPLFVTKLFQQVSPYRRSWEPGTLRRNRLDVSLSGHHRSAHLAVLQRLSVNLSCISPSLVIGFGLGFDYVSKIILIHGLRFYKTTHACMEPVASGSCLFLRVWRVSLFGGFYKWRFSLLERCKGVDMVCCSRGMCARRHGAEFSAWWGRRPQPLGKHMLGQEHSSSTSWTVCLKDNSVSSTQDFHHPP